MKTPEQMAEEYSDPIIQKADRQYKGWWQENGPWWIGRAFLAGYQAAKDQQADADKVMPQWISVKDRLPEDVVGWTMVYGCILSRWSVQPGFYDRQLKKWVSRFINEYEDDEGYATLESVTHWMPLPAAPKDEA